MLDIPHSDQILDDVFQGLSYLSMTNLFSNLLPKLFQSLLIHLVLSKPSNSVQSTGEEKKKISQENITVVIRFTS